MTVSVPIPAAAAGVPGDHFVWVAFRVIPMGWVLAVTLFQHLHRRLALRAPRLGAGLDPSREWRRDARWPLGQGTSRAWWQVYIDDFDAPEVLEAAVAFKRAGTPGDMQIAMRQAYVRAEVAYAEEKSHQRALQLERMGASIDGELGTIRSPVSKTIELVRLILHALGRDYCPWLLMLTLLGRAVRALEFRKPLLSCLNLVWKFSTMTRGGRLNTGMGQELLVCIGYLPLACTDLRAALSPTATVSDASEQGGGVCASVGLTALAMERLDMMKADTGAALNVPRTHVSESLVRNMARYAGVDGRDCAGASSFAQGGRTGATPVVPSAGASPPPRRRPKVLIVSLFDGIAALAVAVSRLPVDIIGMVCSEIDQAARRVVRLRWPGTADWNDIRSITESDVAKLADTYFELCDVCLCGAGSPCQDLSGINPMGTGLSGARSGLFLEVPRIHQLLKKYFKQKLEWFVENVASMHKTNRDCFTDILGVPPIRLCSSVFVPARRPRYYWCTWTARTTGEFLVVDNGSTSSPDRYYDVKRVSGSPVALDWTAEGWRWGGGTRPVPTLLCPRPASSRPRLPAGIRTASDGAKRRWAHDDHRYHLGWYEVTSMVENIQTGALRTPSPEEREALLGFDRDYTKVAHKDPKASHLDDTRNFLLGNSFSVYSVSWLVQQLFLARGLLKDELPPATLFRRGCCRPSWSEIGEFVKGPADYDSAVAAQFTGEFLAIGDRGGSDIRLDVGLPFRPKAWPRASIDPFYWKWRVVLSTRWQDGRDLHINVRELQAGVAALRWRVRAAHHLNARFVHLFDSQVVAAVVSKGRSSSSRLQWLLRKWSSISVAGGLYPVVGYITTEDNPADAPSRQLWKARGPRKQYQVTKPVRKHCFRGRRRCSRRSVVLG